MAGIRHRSPAASRLARRKKTLIIILASAAAVLAAAGILAWQLGWFREPVFSSTIGTPGSASGKSASFREAASVAADMKNRMIKLLWSDGGAGLAGWYQSEGRIGRPPAKKSGTYFAEDQLRYGQFLLEQGSGKAFQAWWLDFRKGYFMNGFVRGHPAGTEGDPGDGGWRVSGMTLRLLAQSCTIWPDRQRLGDLHALSDAMLDAADAVIPDDFDAAVPTAMPTLDPAATPTPKLEATPSASPPPLPSMKVLRLASVDLYAMRQLASLDSRWQAVYDRSLPLVEGGYISDSLPLYALGYDADQNGYLPFSGETPAIDTAEALLTILRLSEDGHANPRSLRWIRDQVFNQKILYKAYHATQGQAASEEECLEGYAIIARIARIEGDRELYDASLELLLWNQATSKQSPVLSMIYRQDADGVITVFASDNTWALLAIG